MRISSLAIVLAAAALLGTPTIAVSGAQIDCTALGGTVEAGNLCRISTSAPTYTMNAEFPTDYPDEQAVLDYLAQSREGFVNVAQPGSRNLPYEMDVTSQSFGSAQTRSVVLKLFQDLGGAHPTTWYKAFTYNIGERKPVAFDTLFAAGTKPLAAIFPLVQRDLERQTGLAGLISPGDGMDPTRYQNFAITDDAVIFFFGQGELLPSDAGATSASVPRTSLPPLRL